jgi:hypothetical protein
MCNPYLLVMFSLSCFFHLLTSQLQYFYLLMESIHSHFSFSDLLFIFLLSAFHQSAFSIPGHVLLVARPILFALLSNFTVVHTRLVHACVLCIRSFVTFVCVCACVCVCVRACVRACVWFIGYSSLNRLD